MSRLSRTLGPRISETLVEAHCKDALDLVPRTHVRVKSCYNGNEAKGEEKHLTSTGQAE